MVFFALYGVLRVFPVATYSKYASPQTLVRSCPAQKILISELDTLGCHYISVDGNKLMRLRLRLLCVRPLGSHSGVLEV